MKIAVIGLGHTDFGELWSKSIYDLIAAAQLEALDDAGISVAEIDELIIGNMCSGMLLGQAHLGAMAADTIRFTGPATAVDGACASGALALRTGIKAIESGRAKVVMVTGAEKLMDTSMEQVTTSFMGASTRELEHFSGASFPGIFGIITRSYMHTHGLTREQLAAVSVKNHHHARLNPRAHLQREITIEDVIQAPMVADPLTLLDCSPASDGAATVIISSVEFARSLGLPFISIIASECALDCPDIAQRKSLISFGATRCAMEKALAVAGIDRGQIDLVELHDAFSMAELIALEDMGFFAPGSAGRATVEGQTSFGGRLPVNLSGGLKGKGHPVGATGISQAIEIVKQLRGSAGPRQVQGARYGLAHNMGGAGTTVVVTIFAQ